MDPATIVVISSLIFISFAFLSKPNDMEQKKKYNKEIFDLRKLEKEAKESQKIEKQYKVTDNTKIDEPPSK